MQKSFLFLSMAVLILAGCSQKSASLKVNIIPAPVRITVGSGQFTVDESFSIVAASDECRQTAEFFASRIRTSTGFPVPVTDAVSGKCAELIIDPESGIREEGYRLSVTRSSVRVEASDADGLFYGMETFMQLLPPQIESSEPVRSVKWKARAVVIDDYPRFSYRGCHVDPCRHFRTVGWIKKQIDVFALYKLNTMHFHLTDDQAWRMEIRKYPELTELGSVRVCGDGTVNKGFYTQDELKDIVAYAAQRHITVIPELEIPGHELAAIHAYPELSCRGVDVPVRQIWGVEDIVMCPGKGLMFDFLKDVIDEMVTIFPSEIYHIGGDECPKAEWERCPKCQKLIRDLGLDRIDDGYTPEQHLQTWIVEYFEKYLAQYGKRIIGWEEILEGNLTRSAMVMSWRGTEGGIEASLKGHDVVMTPSSEGYYLDYFQGDRHIAPTGIGGYAPLEKVYGYEPVADTLRQIGREQSIKGVQGNCWSEYFYTGELAEYRMYPRLLAVAEVGWSPEGSKDYAEFTRKLDTDASVRLAEHDINFYIPMPEQPYGSCDNVAFIDKAVVTFTTTRPEQMFYTVDGSEPDAASMRYTKPLEFTESTVVKIRTVLPCGLMSATRTVNVEKTTFTPPADISRDGLAKGLNVTMIPGYYMNIDELVRSKATSSELVIPDADAISTLLPGSNANNVNVNTPQYAAVARGYVDVPEDGIYYIHSDLEQVSIDGKPIISNAGEVKRYSHKDVSLALSAGLHEIELTYIGNIFGGVTAGKTKDKLKVRPEGRTEFLNVPEELLYRIK